LANFCLLGYCFLLFFLEPSKRLVSFLFSPHKLIDMRTIRRIVNYVNANCIIPDRAQSPKEELANAATHMVGVLFCLIALPFLLKYAYEIGSTTRFWAVCAFSIGMIMVYTSSTLYHSVKNKKLKRALLISDHISIYFLIAGTYTPLVIRFLPYNEAIYFLTIMWSLVLAGSFFKLFFIDRFELLSVLFYVLMGWMIFFIYGPISKNMPRSTLWWVMGGGLSYTVGVYFYIRSSVYYFHSLWHCFVLGGTVAHYISVYKCI
jgi:hemolysin III